MITPEQIISYINDDIMPVFTLIDEINRDLILNRQAKVVIATITDYEKFGSKDIMALANLTCHKLVIGGYTPSNANTDDNVARKKEGDVEIAYFNNNTATQDETGYNQSAWGKNYAQLLNQIPQVFVNG